MTIENGKNKITFEPSENGVKIKHYRNGELFDTESIHTEEILSLLKFYHLAFLLNANDAYLICSDDVWETKKELSEMVARDKIERVRLTIDY